MRWLFFFFFLFLIGMMTAQIAAKKGRDPGIWFWIGFLFGLLGVVAALLVSPVVRKHAEEKIDIDVPPPEQKPPEYEIKDWYYLDSEGGRQGPVPFFELRSLWRNGRLDEQFYVWSEGMEEWMRLRKLDDLMKALKL